MEEIIKTERKHHDAHDILLGILYYFPEEAKWEELAFHEALSKIAFKYRFLDNFVFTEQSGIPYCKNLGKVFDLLELSGLFKRKSEYTKLYLAVIQGYFDDEIKPTFEEKDLEN